MKAIVKRAAEPGLWLEDVPEPRCGTNDVKIRVEKSAICGTDLHIHKWDEWARRTIRPPLVLGHEFVGEVVEVGPGVSGIALGDRVTAEGHITCGRCRNCRAGKRHLCHLTIGVGVQRDGAFAEFVVLPEFNIFPVHPEIPSEIAAFLDPLGNAVHCALSFDLVGEDVLITGAGPIGLMAVAVCRHVGARHVVITDLNDYRLGIAKKLGASRAVNVQRTNLEETIRDLGMSNGFDVGLEMSGSPPAFRDMLRHMYHGGRIALLGILPADAGIDWNDVIFKGLVLKGIYGRELFETWYKMTQMLRSGLDVSAVLTHRFPAERFEEGFEAMATGRSAKVILEWR
jgi:threonine 3-dehydrogenase